MAARTPGESVAKIAVLFLAVAVLNNYRRGELGSWARAKFLGADGSSSSSGRATFASVVAGALGATAVVQGAAAGAAVADVAGAPSLVPVGSTQMSARFAARWVPLAAAAAADGVILTGGAYRSNREQIRLREAHGCGGARLYDSSCKGNPPTAVPGHSRHETGDAIDVRLTGAGGRRSPEYLWLAKNAHRWQVYNLPSEPWHWSIDGK